MQLRPLTVSSNCKAVNGPFRYHLCEMRPVWVQQQYLCCDSSNRPSEIALQAPDSRPAAGQHRVADRRILTCFGAGWGVWQPRQEKGIFRHESELSSRGLQDHDSTTPPRVSWSLAQKQRTPTAANESLQHGPSCNGRVAGVPRWSPVRLALTSPLCL